MQNIDDTAIILCCVHLFVGILQKQSITFLITVCVLLPTMKTSILFKGRAFFFHLVCPILCVASYVLAENHVPAIWAVLPVIVTMVYGAVLIWLNYKKKFEGPYPFFKVHKIGFKKTAIWMAVLVAVVALISVAMAVFLPNPYFSTEQTIKDYLFFNALL